MKYKVSDKEVNKRYALTKERISALGNAENMYVVRCVMGDYYNEAPGTLSQRGFFSLFLQAVQGISISRHFNIPCYIDFGNPPSLYSDPDQFSGDPNFWNYYFEQPFVNVLQPDQPVVVNTYYETYPLRIWDRDFINASGNIVQQHIRFKRPVVDKISLLRNEFLKSRVLGVQIRKTDHSGEVSPVGIDRFYRCIDKELQYFDKIFVATDDLRVLEDMKNRYGKNKIVYNEATRSMDDKAVHQNMNLKNRYALGLEVLTDGYQLSQCHKAILMHSNISYSSLLFNPDLPFILMENLDTKMKRWKTQMLYKLHIHGIRTL